MLLLVRDYYIEMMELVQAPALSFFQRTGAKKKREKRGKVFILYLFLFFAPLSLALASKRLKSFFIIWGV